MTNNLLKINKNRRLFVVARFSKIIKKYVFLSQKKKTLRVYGRLRMLTNKILARNIGYNPSQVKPIR